MNLSIDRLEEFRDSGRGGNSTEEIITILLSAINDWPDSIYSLDQFEEGICKFVGDQVTKDVLHECLSKIDYSKYAWQAESLSQLIQIFNHFEEGKLLKDILSEIQTSIR